MKKFAFAAAVLALAAVQPASAQINITSTSAQWTQVCTALAACNAPGAGVSTTNGITTDNAGSPLRISWPVYGDARDSFTPSSYTFTLFSPGVVTIGATFVLGVFTHNNFDIPTDPGRTLGSANLSYQLGIAGAVPSTYGETFTFQHNETNNSGGCPVGVPPCADIVTFVPSAISGNFMLGGQQYLIDILGFGTSPGSPTSQFVSPEGSSNTTNLYARITTPNVVPEPSTYALMAAGLAGLFMANRRRQRAA